MKREAAQPEEHSVPARPDFRTLAARADGWSAEDRVLGRRVSLRR